MKEYNFDELKDCTAKEAKEFFGEEVFQKMMNTGLIYGITGMMTKDGEFIIYKCDLINAYNRIVGKPTFWD